MAGAYCKFCDRRCFVYRIVPDGPWEGWSGHMATCAGGMAHDLKMLGHTHLTAVNPATEAPALEPGTMSCVRHGDVDYEHMCQRPGESAAEFSARCLGEVRDV